MFKFGFGTYLSNMIIGAVITLIHRVAFTNGIRDLANEDYIAGVTRLLVALLHSSASLYVQLPAALIAIKTTIAIAAGILFVMEINSKNRIRKLFLR